MPEDTVSVTNVARAQPICAQRVIRFDLQANFVNQDACSVQTYIKMRALISAYESVVLQSCT